ncbi:hypothetical protein [Lewinella sp. 4G2]|uniref:hypothetical protein n=1 Tax=Lewinella sp. 4G2 TaxID=1803372 RepID=UPI0007B4C54F|nr:hypothetical protein [Lewinella sp. 4G2]OAV46131.1 hypothetical protein A3850_017885 [Lewinella sp. 4G2]
MRIIFSLLLVSCITAVYPLCAQSNWQPGSITLLNGETLAGDIDDRDWLTEIRNVSFRTTASDNQGQNYDVKDLDGFSVGTDRYLVRQVTFNDSPRTIDKLVAQAQRTTRTTTLALQQLTSGEPALYRYIARNGDYHFFINKDNAPLENLTYGKYRRYTADNDMQVIEDNSFRGLLLSEFTDCQTTAQVITTTTYTTQSLTELFNAYYTCTNQELAEVEPKLPRHRILGLAAGVRFVDVSGRKFVRDNLIETDLQPYFVTGAYFLYYPRSKNRALAFKTGLLYGQYTIVEGVRETPNSRLTYTNETGRLDVALGARLKLNNGRIPLFIEASFLTRLYVTNIETATRSFMISSRPDEVFTEDLDVTDDREGAVFLIGVGANFRRFEIQINRTADNIIGSFLHQTTITVGYDIARSKNKN